MSDAEPKATDTGTFQSLAKEMCAKQKGVVTKPISFRNNEAPEYLENLRRFEEESQKVKIVVK